MTRLVSMMLLAAAMSLPANAVEHRLSAHARTGVLVHLSGSQSAGGAGFSLGLRDTLDERFILGGDLGYLFLIGNTLSLRLFAGVQRKGTWTPAAYATGTALFGQRLAFINAAHPDGPGPFPWSVGVSLAPLRFRGADTTISVLEAGVGFGADRPGLGLSYQLTLVDVSADL